jgi:glycosyltransferase involved in cell wall biosynthesis
MRILFLAPFAAGGPKGTTRWRVLPLARALAAQGHTVRVLVPPYDCPQQSNSKWYDPGVVVENLPLPVFGGAPGQLAMAKRLAQAAAAWKPDLVHCFKPKGPAGLAAWLLDYLPRRRVPLVMDTDDWEAGWNQAVGYPFAWQVFFRWQEHWGLRRANAVTAASRWLVSYASGLRSGVSQPEDYGDQGVAYLPNGVDAVPIAPVISELKRAPVVLAYTRFSEHTPEHLVRVWRRVLEQEPQARLAVAGPRPGVEASRLLGAAKTAGVSHSTLMVGWVPSASRAGLFAATDVALLPVSDTPLNRAKSPMRLLDLLAAGVPIVTQDVGEYGLLVSDGLTGLVTEPGSDTALASAAVRLLRAPLLRERLGQAAAVTMRIEHSWSGLAQRALAAYQIALAARASR